MITKILSTEKSQLQFQFDVLVVKYGAWLTLLVLYTSAFAMYLNLSMQKKMTDSIISQLILSPETYTFLLCLIWPIVILTRQRRLGRSALMDSAINLTRVRIVNLALMVIIYSNFFALSAVFLMFY